MDESITFSDVEVGWDHDSPTPAVWRMLQGPGRNEDTQCSPQLPRTRRMLQRHPRPSTDNHPRFEESRKEVDQIINALRRASREGETTESNVEKRLVIPDLPEEEEESDDERHFDTVPFKELSTNHQKSNTSIDMLFDMSGRGEDLTLTAKSTNPASKQHQRPPPTPVTDVWTDDDLFEDDILMLDVDCAITAASPKSVKLKKNDNSTAQKTSTPCKHSKRSKPNKPTQNKTTDSTSNAKGFLDFFMDEKKPAKPSPDKEKSRGLPQKKNNYKFVSEGESSKNSVNPVKSLKKEVVQNVSNTMQSTNSARINNTTIQNHSTTNGTGSKTCRNTNEFTNRTIPKPSTSKSSVANAAHFSNVNKDSKPMETSIPLDVLELMAEDSWTEDETPKKPPKILKKSTEKLQQPIIKRSTSDTATITNNHKKSYKFTKTGSHGNATKNIPVSKASGIASKQINALKYEKQNVSSDGFSSDDEDLLLQAVALSESQKCSKGNSSSAPKPVKKAASNPSSQIRCTASEIERKKQQALDRKKQRMKKQNFFR